MNAEDVRNLLDELIFDGGHAAQVEAAEAKAGVQKAILDAAEVLLRHEKLLVRDIGALDRQWSA